jgi:hypothetical protein
VYLIACCLPCYRPLFTVFNKKNNQSTTASSGLTKSILDGTAGKLFGSTKRSKNFDSLATGNDDYSLGQVPNSKSRTRQSDEEILVGDERAVTEHK